MSKLSAVLPCPSASQYFVGREDILLKLEGIFGINNVQLAGDHKHIAVLVAHGGSGKTQAALRFVEKHYSRCVI